MVQYPEVSLAPNSLSDLVLPWLQLNLSPPLAFRRSSPQTARTRIPYVWWNLQVRLSSITPYIRLYSLRSDPIWVKVIPQCHTPPFLQLLRFIPEFISRLPSVTTLSPLSAADLRKVLTEVRGSLISQYTALFGYSGVEIKFTSLALDAICARAAERGGGARGLRGILAS
jgi:hypothetical protein